MVVRAEYWAEDPSRIALFFIDERFRELYARQRYHYLLQLIPSDYYRSTLADTLWFELAPDERPETIEHPDQELIASIAPDVLGALQQKGFFAALDELLCPASEKSEPQKCSGDFRYAKRALQACGFERPDGAGSILRLRDSIQRRQREPFEDEILASVAWQSDLAIDKHIVIDGF